MKPIYATVILCALAATLQAEAQMTRRFTAGKDNEYGLVYTLPQTAFDVTLAADKRVETPGEFRLYSKKYLHIDPILEPSVRWTLSGAEVTPVAVPDADERWRVQFRNGSTPFMTLTDAGFPLAVNDGEYFPETATAPTLKAVAATPTILETSAAREAVTEEMLRSNSTAKRAELAAARIYEIRQTRADILSGQADAMPSDGAAMQLVLDNLARQEAALTAMFTGTVSISTEIATFTVTPPPADAAGRSVVARLSVLDGIVDADDLSGAPVYIDFSDVVTAELPVNEKGVTKTFPKDGLAYRIPGQATVTVSYDGRTLASLEMTEVAQYGVVFGLDPGMFTDKKAPSYLLFNPLTGGVRELGVIQNETSR